MSWQGERTFTAGVVHRITVDSTEAKYVICEQQPSPAFVLNGKEGGPHLVRDQDVNSQKPALTSELWFGMQPLRHFDMLQSGTTCIACSERSWWTV